MEPEREPDLKKGNPSVPDKTLDTLARIFCRQAGEYGFNQVDFLRYVNYLLDYSSRSTGSGESDFHLPQ